MKVGNTYFIAGRFPEMKRSKLVASGGYMTRLRIHAAMFVIDSEDKLGKVELYLAELRKHHPEAAWKPVLAWKGS